MLNKKDLVTKYGDSKILAIANSDILPLFDEAALQRKFLVLNEDFIKNIVDIRGEYRLRYELEQDANFKQPIPYVLFYNPKLDKYFCTERIHGDSRLQGKKSLGIGGHVDENESLIQALYREIYEEVGLAKGDIGSLNFQGLILDTSNEVGAVHVGFLYIANVEQENLSCKETETLIGKYISLSEIEQGISTGVFETWSEIAFIECIQKERT